MQFSSTLVAAFLFGTAFAGYEIHETPANSKSGGPGSAKLARRSGGGPVACTDGGICAGLKHVAKGGNECLVKSKYDGECWNGFCWIVNRDPWALLECTFPGIQLDDACYRGNPGDDSYWARGVRNCDSTPGNGNAGCTAEDDPCKTDG